MSKKKYTVVWLTTTGYQRLNNNKICVTGNGGFDKIEVAHFSPCASTFIF
jgi:hypothetical protein